MKVLLVAEQLRRRVPGGIGTYVTGLVRGLAQLPDGPDVELLATPRRPGPGEDPVARWGRPVRTVNLPSRLLPVMWARGIPKFDALADVVHATSLAVPPARGAPLSVMVHDVAWRRHPEAYPPRGRRWHEAALARALRRADLVIVPSGDVASVVEGLGGKGRTAVVAEGGDHLPAPDCGQARALLRGLGVEGAYLLSVSTIEPRKNLPRLVDAYRRARPEMAEPWPLVIVGPAGWGPSLGAGGVPEGVVPAGPVPETVLAALYSLAAVVVYVPLSEGWGLPALEAMTAGAPVLASPVPSVAHAARLVDPLDTDAIAGAIVELVGDDGARRSLVAAGRAHAAGLTWKAAAARHVELWREIT